MSGFSELPQPSVQLASRILDNWGPGLAELASRTRWFNLGVDSLIFLRLDDRASHFVDSQSPLSFFSLLSMMLIMPLS